MGRREFDDTGLAFTQIGRIAASLRGKLAKVPARKKPKGGKLSLRAISAELAAQGFLNERGRPFNPKSIAAMLAARTRPGDES
jgi:hypothetical protein